MHRQSSWLGGWRGAVLIALGIWIGATALQPAVAHVTRNLAHLKGHLDPRYVNVGEALDASDGFGDSCDPDTTAYVDCSDDATVTLPKAGAVLVIVTSHFGAEQTNSSGDCRLFQNGSAASGGIILQGPSPVDAGGLNLVDVQQLPAGTYTYDVRCNQSLGDIEYDDLRVAAVELQVD
jgi:hypothetical protein